MPTAEDKTEPETAAPAASKKSAAADVEKFPVERLLSDECPAITGLERHLVSGALDGSKKTEFTSDEVKALVDKWLTSPVKEG